MIETKLEDTIAIGIIIFLLISLGYWAGTASIERHAVKTECAEYNNTTGDFQWIIKK